jgi:hypothetical protein
MMPEVKRRPFSGVYGQERHEFATIVGKDFLVGR